MIVLALDSSADLLSVALLDDGEPRAERTRAVPRPLSESLLPVVEGVLADARTTLRNVTLVAVATGPGSFNGIRGGIATAEGLALALDIPAVGVPTLDALAYAHAGRAPVVCALLPAGRGEFYGATYEGTWEQWRQRSDYAVGPLDELLADLLPGALVCGRVPEPDAGLIAVRGARCTPGFSSFSTALSLGALATQRLHLEGFDVAASLRPLYLRRPGITRSQKLEVRSQ